MGDFKTVPHSEHGDDANNGNMNDVKKAQPCHCFHDTGQRILVVGSAVNQNDDGIAGTKIGRNRMRNSNNVIVGLVPDPLQLELALLRKTLAIVSQYCLGGGRDRSVRVEGLDKAVAILISFRWVDAICFQIETTVRAVCQANNKKLQVHFYG